MNSLPFSVSGRWSRAPGGHLMSEALEGKQPCQGRAGGTYPWGEPRVCSSPGSLSFPLLFDVEQG